MKRYRVVFTPEAQEQLAELFHYIALAATPEVATRYTEALVSYCESLAVFPERGTKRDDLRPGLRLTHYRKKMVIAFAIATDCVSIIGIFHGGQHYETVFRPDDDFSED